MIQLPDTKICPNWEICIYRCTHKQFHEENKECSIICQHSNKLPCSPADPSAKTFEKWTGFDLDGTLAVYDGWKGPEHIGPPIFPIIEIAKAKQAKGEKIKIFTARACLPGQIAPVKRWAMENGLGDVEVTCMKDFGMVALYDDRCVAVENNTGRLLYWGLNHEV